MAITIDAHIPPPPELPTGLKGYLRKLAPGESAWTDDHTEGTVRVTVSLMKSKIEGSRWRWQADGSGFRIWRLS